MPWHLILLAADAGTPDPINSAISQILGFGVLGVVALALAFRFLVPKGAVDDARKEARGDLLDQIGRLERDVERLERERDGIAQQRDEAQQFTSSQLVPLLVNFTNATSALLPILQDIVRHRDEQHREAGELDSRRRSR